MKEAGAEINEVADRKPFQAAVKSVWDKYGAQHTALIQRIQDVSNTDKAWPDGRASRAEPAILPVA